MAKSQRPVVMDKLSSSVGTKKYIDMVTKRLTPYSNSVQQPP
jgi:hypothetical protein